MKQSIQTKVRLPLHEAINSSRELESVLLNPDKNTFDTTTILSLGRDLTATIQRENMFTPSYSLGQLKSVFENPINSNYKQISLPLCFGDAISEELFVQDLLEKSQSKPLVKDFDEYGVLQGLILALDRDIDNKFESLWESVGMNYSGVLIAGSRPSSIEQRALALMRGISKLESSHLMTPWLLRVGLSSQDNLTKIRRTLHELKPLDDTILTHDTLESESHYDENAQETEPEKAIFYKGAEFINFLDFIRTTFSSESEGKILSDYIDSGGYIDSQTYYVNPIDKYHKFDQSIFITPIKGKPTDGEKIYQDERGYECRFFGGQFIVQTVPSVVPEGSWMSIDKVSDEYAESVASIVMDEKMKRLINVREPSVFYDEQG